ncbi:peroxidase-related enzyme [Chloroflexi bacterium TSY]|nr:peroxidase-related enzyme [Chloroflexi bacterium TSY]
MSSQPVKNSVLQEAISWLTIPDEKDHEEEIQTLFAKARTNVGFLPNVLAAYGVRPDRLKRWIRHFNSVLYGDSELTVTEREMIGVVVSSQNHCLYCLVAHGSEVRRLLDDEVLGDRITFDYRRAGLDKRTLAMLDYAVKLTLHPAECSEADLDLLRTHGFSDETIFDIAETAAMFNFTNRMASATGMMPNREYHNIGRVSSSEEVSDSTSK